ncbi:MAG TPA: ABC transporter permease [Vicinamibacterales bacterium]
MTRWLLRAYALLIHLYPPDLRRAHGDEMRQCARETLAMRGVLALPRLLADTAISVPREWLHVIKGFSMSGIGRDVAYALRLLRRSPGFSAAAIGTLALGIGANAAIFTLADATLLRPLKVTRPDELYSLQYSASYPDFLEYQHRSDLYAGVVGSSGARVNVVVGGRGEFVSAGFVSANYFDVLGIPPSDGRVFRADDDVPNGPGAAVLTERFWRSRFGSDPNVVGRTILVNALPVTIVGIAGRDFHGTSMSDPAKIFLPLTHAPRVLTGFFARPGMLASRGASWVAVAVRLAPGVTPAAAAAATDVMFRQSHPSRPDMRVDRITLNPLGRRPVAASGVDAVRRFVVLLGTVVALTLLIGCANVANLLLSRASARRREIGVRMAVGAGRPRLMRQLFIESLVLATTGGVVSVLVASMALRLLARFQLPGGIEIDGLGLALSAPVLVFTMLVASGTGVLFGLAPAWRAARTDVLESLRDGSRASTGRSTLQSTLVAVQVAVSLVLLAGTALFLRSLVVTLQTNLGFRTGGVATASVNLGAARYDSIRAKAFYDEAVTRIERLPGVTAAAWTTVVPTQGSRSLDATFDGYQRSPHEDLYVYNAAVTTEYFTAAGTRILQGRPFATTDTASGPRVGIINEAAARRYFGARQAVGSRLKVDKDHWIQIVGVAEDAKIHDIDEKPEPFLYCPLTQDPFGDRVNTLHLLVRTAGDEQTLLAPLADVLRSIDATAPLYDISTFSWRVRRLVMPQRMGATLFGAFATLALALSALGIYAVADYTARLRTREIGIRIALGADRTRIRSLVLSQGSIPIAAGLVTGLIAALAAGRLATAFLRGVSARDPLTYFLVSMILACLALVATWIPARRAARVDPLQALRAE